MLAKILKILKAVFLSHRTLAEVQQSLLNLEIQSTLKAELEKNPQSLLRFGNKVYSQLDEDGILQEIFKRIGSTNRVFVEFGIGNGLENNSIYLLNLGWRGLWIDANTKQIEFIRSHLVNTLKKKQLVLTEAFITKDNIDSLIESFLSACELKSGSKTEVDLLSVDIDGNDVAVLNAISVISPRVIVIEYNAKFPPPARIDFKYDPQHFWKGDDFHNSSLSSTDDALVAKGYKLVCCNLTGANAFYVREDLVTREKFPFDNTPELHWQPARFHLIKKSAGHPASFKYLETRNS